MITLAPREVALVLTLDVPADLRDRLVEGLPLGEDDRELLVELASDRLLVAGFDAEYRPTAEGTALEDIITRLTAGDRDE